jgi:hypothetical protein
MFGTDVILFSNVFNLKLVESTDVEPTDVEDQLLFVESHTSK